MKKIVSSSFCLLFALLFAGCAAGGGGTGSTGGSGGSGETSDPPGHTHLYRYLRDADGHWKVCETCGDTTEKEAHSVSADYLCVCGYAFDAPAGDGRSSTDFWVVGSFTDDRSDGKGWGETHSAQWKFHRLIALDGNGATQYVFEYAFEGGEEFKIVRSGGGYWDGELNAGNRSEASKTVLGGDGGGNISFIGDAGYYRLTLHVGNTVTVDAALLFGSGGGEEPHEHSYSTAWSHDETSHWHAAVCGHADLKSDEGEHEFGGGVICGVCGYRKEHVHVPEQTWSQNATSHWKKCALCGEPIEGTEQRHSGIPCGVCGYEVGVSEHLVFELDRETDTYYVSGYEYYDVEDEVRIPAELNGKAVTAIRDKAFMGCNKIKSVVIPDSVTLIDIYSFSGCSALESVSLGSGVKRIGMAAFENCSSLTEISLPSGLETIGDSAFENTAITSIHVPAQVREIGMFAFRTGKLTSVTFEVTAGWQTYAILAETGTPVSVTDAAANATNFSNAAFMGGLANYTWRRS